MESSSSVFKHVSVICSPPWAALGWTLITTAFQSQNTRSWSRPSIVGPSIGAPLPCCGRSFRDGELIPARLGPPGDLHFLVSDQLPQLDPLRLQPSPVPPGVASTDLNKRTNPVGSCGIPLMEWIQFTSSLSICPLTIQHLESSPMLSCLPLLLPTPQHLHQTLPKALSPIRPQTSTLSSFLLLL